MKNSGEIWRSLRKGKFSGSGGVRAGVNLSQGEVWIDIAF